MGAAVRRNNNSGHTLISVLFKGHCGDAIDARGTLGLGNIGPTQVQIKWVNQLIEVWFRFGVGLLPRLYFLFLIARHRRDGNLYTDTRNITSAKRRLDFIVASIEA